MTDLLLRIYDRSTSDRLRIRRMLWVRPPRSSSCTSRLEQFLYRYGQKQKFNRLNLNLSHDRLDWILDEWFEGGSNDSPEKRADRQVWITTLQSRVHIQHHLLLVKSPCCFSSHLESNRGSIRPITHPQNQNPVIGRFFTWSFL